MKDDAEQDEEHPHAHEQGGEVEGLRPAAEPRGSGRGIAARDTPLARPRGVAKADDRAGREEQRADEQEAARERPLGG